VVNYTTHVALLAKISSTSRYRKKIALAALATEPADSTTAIWDSLGRGIVAFYMLAIPLGMRGALAVAALGTAGPGLTANIRQRLFGLASVVVMLFDWSRFRGILR